MTNRRRGVSGDVHQNADGAMAADLALCAQEQIHIPGAIQPHGALLAADDRSLLITHASANLGAILGLRAEEALGQHMQAMLGAPTCRALLAGRPDASPVEGIFPAAPPRAAAEWVSQTTIAGPGASTLHLRAHRSGRHVCIDIEPAAEPPHPAPAVILAQPVLDSFAGADTRAELCQLAVRGLKAVTGYDRVMAYRFSEEGHGEVIAEAREPGQKPYLGHHYPGREIPPQARALYLRQRVGMIADAHYRPVKLLADPALDDGTPLDLSGSTLRSVSPVHREYMANMNTAASLTIGIADSSDPAAPVLWGMLVCHHRVPRIVAPEVRAAAAIIGQVVSLLLATLRQAEQHAQQLERHATLGLLLDRLAAMPAASDLAGALAVEELLLLVNARGALVRCGGALHAIGRTPPADIAARAMSLLLAEAGGAVLAVDDLSHRHGELEACIPHGSGALLLPLPPALDPCEGENAILWFRPEQSRTVVWGGDPAQHAISDPATGRISPRTSFAAWKQTVRGRAAPWSAAELALAGELRDGIAAAVALNAKAQLILLQVYRELSETLEERLEQRNAAYQAEVEERRKVEAQLLRAQQVESIGLLAGGVAHDVNNVLASVIASIELARMRARDPLKLAQFLLSAQEAAERGAKITSHLLAYARRQRHQPTRCDLNVLVGKLKGWVERAIGPKIVLRLDLAAGLWAVSADCVHFETAVINLALNARDAMPEGGTLVIATSNVPAWTADLPPDLGQDDFVCFSVHDSGAGMSAEVLAKASEPFFTTKDVGRGTGLGLSQVYGFCKQSGGTARLSSTQGVGTRVEMFLPVSRKNSQF
jgi:light-regulated signal transduction histidine kinase (bacteriophytochrome)